MARTGTFHMRDRHILAQHPQLVYHEVDGVPVSVDITQEYGIWDFHGSIRWAKHFVDVAFGDELTQLLVELARCPTGPDYSTTAGNRVTYKGLRKGYAPDCRHIVVCIIILAK